MPHTDFPWTHAMDHQLRQMAAIGATAAQVAPAVGKTRSAVISHARKIGVQFLNGTPPWTIEQDARLMQLLRQGWTAEEIGEELGKTKFAVRSHIKSMRKALERKHRNQNYQHLPKPQRTPEITVLQKFVEEDRKQSVADAGVGLNLPMEDLHDSCCRYPVNNDPPFRFCGVAKKRGVYCEAHARIVFQVEKAA